MDLITYDTAVHESLLRRRRQMRALYLHFQPPRPEPEGEFRRFVLLLLVTPAAGIGVLMRRPSHPTETVLPQDLGEVLSLEDSLGPEGPHDGRRGGESAAWSYFAVVMRVTEFWFWPAALRTSASSARENGVKSRKSE